MSYGGDDESWFSSLPPDVLGYMFTFCDTKSLGVLAQVCTRFYSIINQEFLWIRRSKAAIATNQVSQEMKARSCRHLPAIEKCRISNNWKKGVYSERRIIKHRTRYMPWLQLTSNSLWCSKGNVIERYLIQSNGTLYQRPYFTLKGHIEDVCRFVLRQGLVVSGGRDGSVGGWSEETGRFLFCRRRCHTGDVNCVDANTDVIVSGSRDTTVQVWSLKNQNIVPGFTIDCQDRVWSVAISPCNRLFAIGTAGYHQILPLKLYDLQTGTLLKILGNNYRNGAGVLDICYETPFTVLSAGYDTYIRLWDVRTEKCVLEWEDPHDSVVYCLASDNNMTVLSGTSLHGLVRLWDKRRTKHVQMYYVGKGNNSPVYSVAFDPCHMYVALDHSVNLLDYSGYLKNNYPFTNYS